MATKSPNIRKDAFIKIVRPDPKSTEELIVLKGLIGESDLSEHCRVYSDAALNDFIELPEKEILHTQQLNSDENALGGSLIWVKKTTVFTTGDPKLANRIRSTFLEGDIMRAFGNQVGVKLPRVVAKEIPSAFLEKGCKPFSEPFHICHGPTGDLDPNCELQQPPNTRIEPTCVRPTCKIDCNFSQNPHVLCISVNNNTCHFQQHERVEINLQTFNCSDNWPSCAQACFRVWTGFCLTWNCGRINDQVAATKVGNLTTPGDYRNYTGRFNPYQTP